MIIISGKAIFIKSPMLGNPLDFNKISPIVPIVNPLKKIIKYIIINPKVNKPQTHNKKKYQ